MVVTVDSFMRKSLSKLKPVNRIGIYGRGLLGSLPMFYMGVGSVWDFVV